MAGFFCWHFIYYLVNFFRTRQGKKNPASQKRDFFIYDILFFMQFSYFFYTIQKEFLTLLNKLIYY